VNGVSIVKVFKNALLSPLATWHLPGEPVGPPIRWTFASMLKEGEKRRTEPRDPYLWGRALLG